MTVNMPDPQWFWAAARSVRDVTSQADTTQICFRRLVRLPCSSLRVPSFRKPATIMPQNTASTMVSIFSFPPPP